METDTLGGKPLVLSLVQMLRLVESRVYDWEKQKKAGQEYTIPTVSNEGEITEPQLIDELIANWEKEKVHLEEVIAWAESREPGSSHKGNGKQLLEEYKNLFQ